MQFTQARLNSLSCTPPLTVNPVLTGQAVQHASHNEDSPPNPHPCRPPRAGQRAGGRGQHHTMLVIRTMKDSLNAGWEVQKIVGSDGKDFEENNACR